MKDEVIELYDKALREGQKYYKAAVRRGEYPYPPALDYILDSAEAAGYVDLGLVDIPAERIAGTRTLGRSPALAGNFMPLMGENTEFCAKWMELCSIQLGDEGIRDPIKCYEYMGRFYVEEGNKRVSVLKYLEAPTIPGMVTRVIPRYTEEPEQRVYYEFMWFYSLTRLYIVDFRHPGEYAKLLAALGRGPEHVWTEEERLSFSAAFTRFREAFDRCGGEGTEVTAAEALLVWMQMYPFDSIRTLSADRLEESLRSVWADVSLHAAEKPIVLNTEPAPAAKPEGRGLLGRLLNFGRTEHLNVAFLYRCAPDENIWSGIHDEGRADVQQRLGERVSVRSYVAEDGAFADALERAVEEGAEVVFATAPEMTVDCRRAAARHKDVRFLVYGVSQPYAGVRFYCTRIYEAKFLAGAVAGAMAEEPEVGYIANYPIAGVPAEINAFALGLRMTNPRARVRVCWECVPGDPMEEFRERGIRILSNRIFLGPDGKRFHMQGTWKRDGDLFIPLTDIVWHWGRLYEQILLSIFSGTWDELGEGKAVNYWWGMDSGMIEPWFSDALPEGVRYLGELLRKDLLSHTISPFRCHIEDRDRVLRNDGSLEFTPEQLMTMDWFCDNVVGGIPPYPALLPEARKPVRLLGLYKDALPPEND